MRCDAKMKMDMCIARIVDAVEKAYVCIDAAMRFADYLMQDRNEEKRVELEAELPVAKAWVEKAMNDIARLEKELLR